jgi:AraC family transcriptional regulator
VITLNIQVIEKGDMKVIGLAWNGSYSQINMIPALFDQMEARIGEVLHKTNEPVFIAPFHSRETEFTYYVTTPVEKIEDIPDGMVGFIIPGKKYVFATHYGAPDKVQNTYLRMFSWMKEHGYEQDYHALSMEVYKDEHKDINASGEKLCFDIYLPLKESKNE